MPTAINDWEEVPIDDWEEVPISQTIPKAPIAKEPSALSKMGETVGNIGKVFPATETAANLVTSSYGVPLSGLAGLLALPFGADAAGKVVEGVQKGLVYQPQTESGKRLTETATYPIKKLDDLGGTVGGAFDNPLIATAAHTAITGAPALLGAKKVLTRPTPAKTIALVDTEIAKAIDSGINKAIKPTTTKKGSTYSQVQGYMNRAKVAVNEIINNKDNLNIVDAAGQKIEGLPKNVSQFSQAVEQTKRIIYEEYDALAKQTDKQGVRVDLGSISKELDPIMKSKTLQDLSPETIQYAQKRSEALQGRSSYSAVETQEAIQMLNQTLEKFKTDPSLEMKGKALIDALVANKLREQLDMTIEKTTGEGYQALKNRYGALKSIESDVTRKANQIASKKGKPPIAFSDVYTGYHALKGILAAEPAATVAAAGMGGAYRAVSWVWDKISDPDRMVKNMFEDVENLNTKRKSAGVTNAMLKKY